MPSPKIPCDCAVCGTNFMCDAANYRRARHGERYCSRKCYYLRHGATLEERFWRMVQKGDGCWEWRGHLDDDGYGSVGSFGNDDREKAHRFSYLLHHGPITDGLLVLHRCDNPPCVRPDHLFLGTNEDNMRDCAEKGRKAGAKRFTFPAEQVRAIRHRHSQGTATFRELARELGVDRIVISRMVRRVTYRHVV